MARGLGDVLHHFLPEAGEASEASEAPAEGAYAPEAAPGEIARPAPGALPCLSVPLEPGDVVHAALVWNLAVEAARGGARAALVTPFEADEALWPSPGRGPLGAEVVPSPAPEPAAVAAAAREVAVARAGGRPGLVLVPVPPEALDKGADLGPLLRWTLLLTTPEPSGLQEAFGRAERLLAAAPGARVGVTVHGVRSVAEARRTFERLAAAVEGRLGAELLSYGLCLDELDVYRAIVRRCPVGVERPGSRAARALADVARLLVADAGAGEAAAR